MKTIALFSSSAKVDMASQYGIVLYCKWVSNTFEFEVGQFERYV